MKHPLLATLLVAAALTPSARADFSINSATGPFAVSFRGAADTTYFGWLVGTFDANPQVESSEVLTTPGVTVGTSVAGIGLNQLTGGDILAGSNNIYNGVGANSAAASFQLDIPTSGTAGSGFTTIIIQGNGATFGGGGGLTTTPVFASINGVAPTFVAGGNANGALQFWAKYELPGNAASYAVTIDLLGGVGISPSSISDLRVDTQWSASGYAPDVAAVPEPGVVALFGLGVGVALVGIRRRPRA